MCKTAIFPALAGYVLTTPVSGDWSTGNPIPWCGLDLTSCSQFSKHGDWPSSIEDLDSLKKHPEVQDIENFIYSKLVSSDYWPKTQLLLEMRIRWID